MSRARWLLDTNVVSELAKARPSASVLAFIAGFDLLAIPSIAVYELERGVALLPAGKRRRDLVSWLATILAGPIEIVPLDGPAARAAARIEAAASRRGRTIEVRDALIAGTAASARMGIATRNTAHLGGHGVRVVDLRISPIVITRDAPS
ncbi:MAG: PIN domain-containing protein [Myxococcota bacterium]|nr:PIN domain-containing protein [Myxococcota bacterium]